MNEVLARWNRLRAESAADTILPCCGSKAWAQKIALRRPCPDEASLLTASDEIWQSLSLAEWMQAFSSHPRIGESRAEHSGGEKASEWSAQEQSQAATAREAVKIALARANREYERRFHRIFIICASGKSAQEILRILKRRLKNDQQAEIQETAEQQRQIIQLRLRKWLQG